MGPPSCPVQVKRDKEIEKTLQADDITAVAQTEKPSSYVTDVFNTAYTFVASVEDYFLLRWCYLAHFVHFSIEAVLTIVPSNQAVQ